MADEIRIAARGQGQLAGEWIERSDLTRQYDQLIAAAGGDIALREFWRLGKHLFQAAPKSGRAPILAGRGGDLPSDALQG